MGFLREIPWEQLATLGAIAIILVIVMRLLNMKGKVDWKKKTVQVEAEPELHNGCNHCSKLNRVMPLVIDAAITAGAEMTSVKTMELLDSEMDMAKEHLTVIREGLHNLSKDLIAISTFPEEVSIIMVNVIVIYMHTVEQTLMFSFMRNNWKKMNEVEFNDMIDRKQSLLRSEWTRIISVFFPSKRYHALVETMKTVMTSDDAAFKEFNRVFDIEIEKVFRDARRIKNAAEDKSAGIQRELNESIMQILKAHSIEA